MDPTDVNVITLDGKTHSVTDRTAITVAVQTGSIVPMQYADAEGNITVADGRANSDIVPTPGTRYACSCGLTFDAINDTLAGDPRFDQAPAVDCPGC